MLKLRQQTREDFHLLGNWGREDICFLKKRNSTLMMDRRIC